MAQLLIRKLDEAVKEKLRARARRGGRSMEAEVRSILTEAVQPALDDKPGWATRFRQQLKGAGFTDEEAAKLELRSGPLRNPFSE